MSRNLLPIASRRETTALAWTLLKKRRGALVLTLLLFGVVGVCGLAPPWLLGAIVDAVDDGASPDVVTRAVLGIVAASVVGGIATALAVWMLSRTAEPGLAELREQVLENALHLDSARLEEAGSGDLLARVGEDVRTITHSLVNVVPLLVGSAIAIVFTAGGLFALDWRLGLAGLAAAPFYLGALRWYLPRSGPYYRRERIAQGERAEAMVTGMHGAPTLRAFSREHEHMERITTTSRSAMQIAIDVFRLQTRLFGRVNRSECLGLVFILVTGFVLVGNDATTVGAVTAAALYFHRLFNPIGELIFLFDTVQSAGASLARLAGVAGLSPPVIQPGPTPAESTLQLKGVSHSYVDGHPVLTDADITLLPGERVALVGETGAGKTTLAAIAAGALDASSGSVVYGGVPLTELAARDHVALITQEVHVFTGTARENVDLARPDATDEEVRHALEVVSATGWVEALPDGLDTVVGDHGHPLSAAQAQQLALARVVLHDPSVVVLDEATAEAGSSGARELEQAAAAITRGRSALIVAHRLTQSASADRVVVLDQGRIVEQGTHDGLVSAGGRYATLWAAWSS